MTARAAALTVRAGRFLAGQAGPGPASALAVITLLSAFLATAGPRESTALQDRALQHTLAAAGSFSVSAGVSWPIISNSPAQRVSPRQLAVMTDVMGAAIGPPLRSPPAARWEGMTTPFRVVANPAPQAILSAPPLLEIAYRSALARNARLIAGSLPGAATPAGRAAGPVTLHVAVTAPTAARFGLRPGSRIRLLPPGAAIGAPVVLQVTGVVAPAGRASAFWALDPALAAPTVLKRSWVAGVFIGPAELPALESVFALSTMQVYWDFPLPTGGLTATQVPAEIRMMRTLSSGNAAAAAQQRANPPWTPPPTITVDGLAPLTSFQAGQAEVAVIGSLLTVGVFVVALILLLVCALVMTEAHAAELALLAARGGSRGQAAVLMLVRTAGVAVPALAVGVAAGLVATPADGNSTSWLLVSVVALTVLAGPVLLAWWGRAATRALAGTERSDLVIPRRSARRLVAEAAALAVVVGAVAALRVHGAGAGAGTGGDSYVSAAPVLVAIAAGLIVARFYPYPLRLLLRLRAPRGGTVGYLGLARAARARPESLLPALALVIALAVIALGGTIRGAVTRGQVAASWRQAGADAVIQTTGASQVVGSNAERSLAAVPGVTHAVAAYAADAHSALAANLLEPGFNSMSTGVAIVDPARYAALISATPWPPFPARLMARPGPGGSVPVIASPRVAAAMRRGASSIVFANITLRLQLAGTAEIMPALPGSKTFIIMPSWVVHRLKAAVPPDRLLLTGAHIDMPALRAALARTLPHNVLVSRAALLAATASSPSVQGADVLFDLCVAAAIACSIAAVLLGLLMSARERTRLAAWLAALGMTDRQNRRLAMMDALPMLLIAVVGGGLAGLLLGPLIAPALDLSAFTGSNLAVPVQPDLLALIAPGAVVLALVMLMTTAQSLLTRRRMVAGVLRLEEGR